MQHKIRREQMAGFIARGVNCVLQHLAVNHHAQAVLKVRRHGPQHQRQGKHRSHQPWQGKNRDAEQDCGKGHDACQSNQRGACSKMLRDAGKEGGIGRRQQEGRDQKRQRKLRQQRAFGCQDGKAAAARLAGRIGINGCGGHLDRWT